MLRDGRPDSLLIAEIRPHHFHAGRLQHLHQQIDRRAIKRARGQHYTPAVNQRREDRQVQRRHPRSAGQRAFTRFQRRGEFFQRLIRRIAMA